MKRTFILILAAVVAAALFGGLVHAVLVVAHLSDPAATTIHGLTSRRLWATSAAMLALASVIVGGLALRRSIGRTGPDYGKKGAIRALVAGPIAALNGGLNVAVANGGPGTGNGVVGGAAALVLGLVATAIGGLALARSRRTESKEAQMRNENSTLVSVRYMIDDVRAAAAFYTKHFGFTLDLNAAPAFALVSRGNLRLLLSGEKSSGRQPVPDGAKPVPGGWNRIVLLMSDLKAEVARLRIAGVKFCRDDIVSGPGGSQIWITDPSGNLIELFQAKH